MKKVNAENDRMKKLIALLLHFKYLLQLAVQSNDFDKQWKSTDKHQVNFKDDYNQCLDNFASLIEELPFVSEIESQYQDSKTDHFGSFNDFSSSLFASDNLSFDNITSSFAEDSLSNINFTATSNFLELEYGNPENALTSNSNDRSKNPRGRPKKAPKHRNSIIRNGKVKRVKRIRIKTKKPKPSLITSICSNAKASIPVANSQKTVVERLSFLKENPLYILKSNKVTSCLLRFVF